MKAIFAGLLVAVVNSSVSDFPPFDLFHAHCGLTVLYPGQTCDYIHKRMLTTITEFEGKGSGPAKGTYAMVEEGPKYFWTTRTAPDGSVDEELF
jgi:hypothetical protein